jgi:hypothetical protein
LVIDVSGGFINRGNAPFARPYARYFIHFVVPCGAFQSHERNESASDGFKQWESGTPSRRSSPPTSALGKISPDTTCPGSCQVSCEVLCQVPRERCQLPRNQYKESGAEDIAPEKRQACR